MRKDEQALLSFVGNQGPYTVDRNTKKTIEGPILSLLRAKNEFGSVFLFHTADRETAAEETEKAIKGIGDQIDVKRQFVPIEDKINHVEILRNLRPLMKEFSDRKDAPRYFILVSPGTPAMHACWIFLAASGEIIANILYKREEQCVTDNQPLFAEINPRAPEFPHIMPHVTMKEVPDITKEDIEKAIAGSHIIGDHPKWMAALQTAAKVARNDFPILILGESGTGKEVLATFIHGISKRAGLGKFVPVNCGGIPAELIESELFGHRKGAFTSALFERIGKFEEAHGGTIFLDEIGEMPLAMQAKLLRTLGNGEIQPLGKQAKRVDARVIAATNRDIQKAIRAGRFREDIYFRIAVHIITLPPLRERRSDIPKLALYFLDDYNKRWQKNRSLTLDALKRLQDYHWPGNIRELQNIIYRSAGESTNGQISADRIIFDKSGEDGLTRPMTPHPEKGFSMPDYIERERVRLVREALEMTKENQSEAARLLGVKPQNVNQLARKHGYSNCA